MKCSVKCKCKCYPIQIPGSVVLVMHIVPNSEGSFIHRVATSIVRIVLIVVISRVKYEFGLKWMCDCDFATPNCRAVPLFCHYGAAFFQIPPISAPAFHVSREVILLFLTSPTVKYFASRKQCPASRRSSRLLALVCCQRDVSKAGKATLPTKHISSCGSLSLILIC